MTPEQWQKIREIASTAATLDAAQRAAMLRESFAGDAETLQGVEALLAYEAATIDAGKTAALPVGLPGPLAAARFAPGAILAGRYRIVGQLGKGGMGEVYRADDLKLGQSVALKFLTEQLSADAAMLNRFLGEVRTARQVTHPNVCRVHDIGEVRTNGGTQHFLSMEYIDGEDLSSLLRRIGRLPSDKAVEISSQLCAGLAAAHDAGILHRDLKPANVMIDGRGKVRITDFGLAGFADQFHGQEVLAGTPAYMAPEQLAGTEVTVRSDLYSLGLILYEIFTGKRVYEPSSLDELRRLHESGAPTQPSLHVKDIDPQVEKLILRCLEKDPARRPASAIQVAAALPGNDPLAAALAAGETPSPEMVAAAPKAGSLRPAVAVASFLASVLILGFLLLTAKKVLLHEQVPLQKSPEILADRAQTLCAKFGYADAPVDTAYGFERDRNYWEYAFQTKAPAGFWERIRTGQPLTIYFWYRQSPRYLMASGGDAGHASLSDPPADLPGMTSLILDPRGRLVEWQAVPPQIIPAGGGEKAQPDWTPLFGEAGLDPARFAETAPQWTPPGFADQLAAWQGPHPDHPEVSIRIEAAAWRGRPVYFRIVAPWDKARRQEAAISSVRSKASNLLATLLMAALLSGAIFLAQRNLRLKRGDRSGANKVAALIFGLRAIGSLMSAHHAPTSEESRLLFEILSSGLLWAVLSWIFYLAMEPYVRRYWPNLLISWTRLLAGDFRDPMVGRDVLLGGLLGLIGHPTMIFLGQLLAVQMGNESAPRGDLNPATLSGSRQLLAYFLLGGPTVITMSLAMLLLLLLAYILLRREWLAAAVLWAIGYTLLLLNFSTSWPVGLLYSLEAAAVIITVSRLGLLATMAYFLYFNLCFEYPLTLNFSNWYAGNAFFALGVILALSLYGCYISLGARAPQPTTDH